MKSRIDALGRKTSYIRDAGWRPLVITNADLSVVQYTYNSVGQVLTHVDELSRATTNTYDNAHKRIATVHPDGTTESWTYNQYSQVLTHTGWR